MRVITLVRGTTHFLRRVQCCWRQQLAYVGGWSGNHNLGDELLAASFQKLFPSFRLIPVRGHRHERLAASILPPFKAAVLAGGTLINKNGSLAPAEIYSSTTGTFFVFGTGVASDSFWQNQTTDDPQVSGLEKWEHVLRRSIYVGLRGPFSALSLRKVGFENVDVIGDPVLALASDRCHTQAYPRQLGLNLGVSGGHMWGSESRLAGEYVKLALLARKAGWVVHWFVVWPGDLDVTRRAAWESSTGQNVHQVYSSPDRYLELVGRVSVFLGMKLHAVALATCVFVPSVMLEYRPKCRDYMASIGHEDFTVRTDRFDARQAWQLIEEMAARRSVYSQQLRTRVLALQAYQRIRAAEVTSRICASV